MSRAVEKLNHGRPRSEGAYGEDVKSSPSSGSASYMLRVASSVLRPPSFVFRHSFVESPASRYNSKVRRGCEIGDNLQSP
jgi:hypothetical protein